MSRPCKGSTAKMVALIDGALQLQTGQPRRGANFYNYDKQYLSYWLCKPPGPSVASPAKIFENPNRT